MWGTDRRPRCPSRRGLSLCLRPLITARLERIGLHAAKRGTRFEHPGADPPGIRERFGGIGEGVARMGLRLRHDHGSNYLADDFRQEVAFFGIRKFRRASCGSPKATASRSASSAR